MKVGKGRGKEGAGRSMGAETNTKQTRVLISATGILKPDSKDNTQLCFPFSLSLMAHFFTDENFGEGCWSVLVCSLVTVESDSYSLLGVKRVKLRMEHKTQTLLDVDSICGRRTGK